MLLSSAQPRIVLAGAILIIGTIAFGLVNPGAASAAPTPRPGDKVVAITWNMCGNASHCDYRDEPWVKADAVVRSIDDRDADVVLLQETCTSHERELKSRLGSGWTVVFANILKNDEAINCDAAGGQYGEIIAIRAHLSEISDAWPVPLSSPSGKEQRVALCVRQDSRGLQVCNAHFSNKGEDPEGTYRARQARTMAELIDEGVKLGYRTITGGDFNAEPPDDDGATPYSDPAKHPTLVPLYNYNIECDEIEYGRRDGENTTGYEWFNPSGTNKIDYLFVDRGFSSITCDATSTDYSDHVPLVGWFTMR